MSPLLVIIIIMGIESQKITLSYPAIFRDSLVNSRHMHKGYGSRSVCLSVCLSVTTLAATYLVFKSQVKCHWVLHDVFDGWIVWILLKMLCSKVLV